LDIIRGQSEATSSSDILNYQNLPIPSLSTLKRWLPEYQFGSVEDTLLKDLLEEACNTNVKREYLISWDEMEIRSGIVICLRQARAVGFAGKMDRSIQKLFDNKISVELKDIAKQVCQFFIISLDGQMSIPIFACGYEAKNGRKYLEESFRIIKEKIDTASNSRIKIVGGCSDGATASLEFATKQTIFPNYRHLGDFSHLVKRM